MATNVDFIINQGGTLLIPGGIAVEAPYVDTNSNYVNIKLDRGSHIMTLNYSSSYVSRNYYLWIEYTKTS